MSKYGDLIKPAESIISKARENNTRQAIYRYPSDLGPHAIVFNFKKYEYNSSTFQNSVNVTSSIVLPIPKNIQDNYNVNVNQTQLGILGAGLADVLNSVKNVTAGQASGMSSAGLSSAASEMAKGAVTSITDAISGIGGMTASDFGTAARYLSRAGLGAISPDLRNSIDLTTGTIVNPHTALVFDGVGLKPFTFDWQFSPKNEEEHKVLTNIIKKIKHHILPTFKAPIVGNGSDQRGGGSSFARGLLEYPSLVDIFFVGLDQRYFLYYKTCMVNQLNIDFSPSDGLVLFRGPTGAKPVFTNLSMSLTESAIHTSEDYSDGDI